MQTLKNRGLEQESQKKILFHIKFVKWSYQGDLGRVGQQEHQCEDEGGQAPGQRGVDGRAWREPVQLHGGQAEGLHVGAQPSWGGEGASPWVHLLLPNCAAQPCQRRPGHLDQGLCLFRCGVCHHHNSIILIIITTTTIIITTTPSSSSDSATSFIRCWGEDAGALLENAIARYPDMKIMVTWSFKSLHWSISIDVIKKASAYQTGLTYFQAPIESIIVQGERHPQRQDRLPDSLRLQKTWVCYWRDHWDWHKC